MCESLGDLGDRGTQQLYGMKNDASVGLYRRSSPGYGTCFTVMTTFPFARPVST